MNSNPPDAPSAGTAPPDRPKRAGYVPAIGPKLKKLLHLVFALLALLGANSLYLGTITFLEWRRGETYQNQFYLYMFLGHVILGLIFLLPFLIFGTIHMLTARRRKNKRAIRVGYALFLSSIVILVTGLLLIRIGDVQLKNPGTRNLVYWLHVGVPFVAAWLYWLHRLVGQKIKWKLGFLYGGLVTATVGGMVYFHTQDPREWNKVGPVEGVKYFEPSLARTSNGGFIAAHVLSNDQYCLKCHEDAYEGWFHSAHHFSSFNNPAYLASVRETREVSFQRDGHVKASRWCAGCHDPVPFFSGAFDDPNFDDINHPTAQAGITCTTCHAITNINSTRGNADYTIEEPLHYPFTFSENSVLQWVNQQLVKAKPTFHKKTFLKPFHASAEFCSTCHKVHLPKELTAYKDFLRGQNHYDAWLLSGVSGHGVASFYYPPTAQTNCNGCHMPLQESDDFGAQRFAGSDKLSIHKHLFASGNTGVPGMLGFPEKVLEAHREFLDGALRVDVFGIKEGGAIDGRLHAPLRPDVPTLEPGESYLLETVIRTLKLGHLFTQGTVDSNEVWMDVTLKLGDRIIGRSGGMDERGEVDRWSHFVNVFMLDRHGNRINRRNAQDIFTPLYNHQIPPGAGQVVHYGFTLPEDVVEPLTVDVKLQYRKFDYEYMNIVAQQLKPNDNPIAGYERGTPYVNHLPVMTLAQDSITFPVRGVAADVENPERDIPVWQRWNDYGIGLLLEGKAELRQAEEAFRKVEQLDRFDGPLNLARVLLREGRVDEAGDALDRASKYTDPPAPEWTLSWFSGLVNREQLRLEEAEANFKSILYGDSEERRARFFDFSRDYTVRNMLGLTLFDRAQQVRTEERASERTALLEEAALEFHKTLEEDSENAAAHYNLGQIYGFLERPEKEREHRALHQRYKVDDTAQGEAVRKAREKYPAANHAAESLVIYNLQRPEAPGLDSESLTKNTATKKERSE
jgi:tetratricopeptide (TPR) repeat protein